MPNSQSPPSIALITHNDLDAAGCACILKRIYGRNNVVVKYCSYNNLKDKIKEVLHLPWKFNKIYISDITPDAEDLELLINQESTVKLYDHHETRRLTTEAYGQYSNKYCATRMLYNAHRDVHDNNLIHQFVYAVDAFDCWKLDSPHRKIGETLDRLCKFLGIEKFVEMISYYDFDILNETFSISILKLDEILLHNNKKYVSHKVQSSELMYDVVRKCFCGVSTAYQCHNEIAHGMLDKYDNASYAVVVRSEGTINLRSRRSVDGIQTDVSAIAVQYGGGGHMSAGGISTRKNAKKFLSDLKIIDCGDDK